MIKRIISILLAALLVVSPVAALSEAQLDRFDDINAYYYNPDGNIRCVGGAGIVAGNNNAEKVWNYFVSANIAGLSNNAAAIAGILGNLQQESGINPFSHSAGSSYYGIYQTNNPIFIQQIEDKGWGQYWGTANAPEDIVNQALQLELDFLIQHNPRFSQEAYSYLGNLGDVSEKSPESYAELFEVAVEGAATSSSDGGSILTDAGVISIATQFFNSAAGGGRYYQDVAQRRNYARAFYSQYATNPSITATEGSTGSITIIGDSITVRAESELKSLMPSAKVYAQVSKQFYTGTNDNPSGYSILQSLVDSNELGGTLIYALGTNNSQLTLAQAQAVVDLAGSNTTVVFVTNYSKGAHDYTANNNVLKAVKAANTNVQIAYWDAAASSDPAKYLEDDVHPSIDAGTKLFAQTIKDALGKVSTNTATSCSSDYDYTTINVDGYVFPLAGATKANYLHPKPGYSVLTPLPCTNYSIGVCHHDTVAVDLGLRKLDLTGTEVTPADYPDLAGKYSEMYYYSTGVKVLALTDGTITSYQTYSRATDGYEDQCASVQYRATDGHEYWLGHMSYNPSIKAGDTFKAGDAIGIVGPPPCAMGTQAHLHINISPATANDTAIYDLMNKLYEALPEN